MQTSVLIVVLLFVFRCGGWLLVPGRAVSGWL